MVNTDVGRSALRRWHVSRQKGWFEERRARVCRYWGRHTAECQFQDFKYSVSGKKGNSMGVEKKIISKPILKDHIIGHTVQSGRELYENSLDILCTEIHFGKQSISGLNQWMKRKNLTLEMIKCITRIVMKSIYFSLWSYSSRCFLPQSTGLQSTARFSLFRSSEIICRCECSGVKMVVCLFVALQ